MNQSQCLCIRALIELDNFAPENGLLQMMDCRSYLTLLSGRDTRFRIHRKLGNFHPLPRCSDFVFSSFGLVTVPGKHAINRGYHIRFSRFIKKVYWRDGDIINVAGLNYSSCPETGLQCRFIFPKRQVSQKWTSDGTLRYSRAVQTAYTQHRGTP